MRRAMRTPCTIGPAPRRQARCYAVKARRAPARCEATNPGQAAGCNAMLHVAEPTLA